MALETFHQCCDKTVKFLGAVKIRIRSIKHKQLLFSRLLKIVFKKPKQPDKKNPNGAKTGFVFITYVSVH